MASKESESESEDGPAESPVHQATLRHQEEDSDVESMIVANEDLDKDDEEFVLADEDGELGVPTGSDDIPLEFTRHAYKQPKDYFQDAVEWMVHNQLNPAFPRTGNRFSFAFGKLENEVKGRAGSQLVSSAWNANFRRAVMARPHIEVTLRSCDGYSCDACNRSGHPATSEVKFYGKAYSMDTLEPLVDEDSGEEQQSDDDRERDRDGNILPDEGTRYLLGK